MRYLPRLAALFAQLAACASSQPGGGPGGDCGAKRSAAIDRVSKVLDANGACAADADCVTLAFGNSCFDACTRSVSKSGADAVNATLKSPENNDCKECTVIAPPCAPPSAPACVAGRCQ